MIRIRCADAKGSLIPLPANAAFIEICDDQGKVAAVVSYDPVDQSISVFDGDSEKAKRYTTYFNVDFVDKKYNITDVYKQQVEQPSK